jgi:Ca-activated chloride channel family protein
MLFIAVDASMSMTLTDVSPSRLEALKKVLKTFINKWPSGQGIEIILFEGEVKVLVNLTADKTRLLRAVDEIKLGTLEPGTNLGDSMFLGVERIIDMNPINRDVILITDGANNIGSKTPEESLGLAKEANVRIHTISIGDPSFKYKGISMLDKKVLSNISRQTGGYNFHADSNSELEEVFEKLIKLL